MLGQYKKKAKRNNLTFVSFPSVATRSEFPLCLKEFRGSQVGILACDSILEVLTGLQQTRSSELSSANYFTQLSVSKAGCRAQQRVLGLLILLIHFLHSRGKATN